MIESHIGILTRGQTGPAGPVSGLLRAIRDTPALEAELDIWWSHPVQQNRCPIGRHHVRYLLCEAPLTLLEQSHHLIQLTRPGQGGKEFPHRHPSQRGIELDWNVPIAGDYHDYPQGMEPKRQRTAYTRHQMLELEKVQQDILLTLEIFLKAKYFSGISF